MGWLGGEDITTVGTSVARVVQDDGIHPTWRTGALKALTQHGDITDYVSQELLGGMGLKGRQYYNFGKNHYPYGLPSGMVNSPSQGQAAVEAILEALEGTGVLMAYSFYSSISYSHLAWKEVDAAYGLGELNELTSLSASKGVPVTLEYIVLVMSAATQASLPANALKEWGGPFVLMVDDLQVGISLRILYSWTQDVIIPPGPDGDPGSVTPTYMEEAVEVLADLSALGYVPGASYFQASYLLGSDIKYWEYRIGEGSYPELDGIFNTAPTSLGSYFPFGYFRYEKVSMKDPSQIAGYAASKKMLKLVGLDYDALIDGIHDNPDIANVEQAMLVMAVPAVTSNAVEQEYLYSYFSSQFTALNGEVTTLSQEEMLMYFLTHKLPDGATVVIEDSRFKMALDHKGLFKRQVNGVFGAVGSYASGTAMVGQSYIYYLRDGDGTVTEHTYAQDHPSHWYRKQVSATQYEELQVLSLTMTYYIEPGGGGGWYTTQGVGDSSILLVPLDLSVVGSMNIRRREELYTRAMHYVFNSLTVVHLAWYQTELFGDLLLAAAIVFTVVTLGEGYEAINLALALGEITLTQAITQIAVQAAIYIGKAVAAQLFVKAVGVKIAFIVAIIAIATGTFKAMGTDSLKEATKALTVMGVNLVDVVNNLTSAINTSIKADFLDLQGEMAEFEDYKTASTKLLEDAQALLEKDTTLMAALIPGESIGDLVHRTTHYGNIGTVALDAIHNYVERSLTLPTFNDTMGKTFNAKLA